MADMRHLWRPTLLAGLLGLTLFGCSAKVTAPFEPPASVRRGDLAFQDGDYEAAIAEYRNYLDQAGGDYSVRVYYKTALAEYHLGRHRDALNTIREIDTQYPDAQWVQVEALRGDAQRELGKSVLAVQSWDVAWGIGNQSDREKLSQRIVQLAREMPNEQLAESHHSVTHDEVRDLIERSAERRLRSAIDAPLPDADGRAAAGQPGRHEPALAAPAESDADARQMEQEEAAAVAAALASSTRLTPREAADRARIPAISSPTGEPAAEETTEPAAVAVAPEELAPATEGVAVLGTDQKPIHGKVGVLLPLSGDGRDAGERALRGIRLVFGAGNENILIRDTSSDPMTALSMLSQFAADPTVKLVIGPVGGDDAERVAPAAERARLPLLLLSQQDGLAGEFAMQVGMTRSKMLGTLLDYAMGRGRIRNIGILYPEDIAGKQLLVTLRQEVERRGGTVVGAQGYSPATRAVAIGSLMKWRDEKQVQGIFLPDDVAAAEGFARFMQREMPDVTLLGIRGWEGLAVEREDGGENISGVLFTDTFFPGSDRQGTQDFVDRFTRAFGTAPGTQEAEAYDAALVARRVLESGALTRADIHQELRYPGPIEGAAGELTATPSGFERRLFLLRVFDGKLQEVGG